MTGRPAPSDEVVVRSRIVGKFNGWSGSTVFHLENGQTDRTDRYWTPTVENPEAGLRVRRTVCPFINRIALRLRASG